LSQIMGARFAMTNVQVRPVLEVKARRECLLIFGDNTGFLFATNDRYKQAFYDIPAILYARKTTCREECAIVVSNAIPRFGEQVLFDLWDNLNFTAQRIRPSASVDRPRHRGHSPLGWQVLNAETKVVRQMVAVLSLEHFAHAAFLCKYRA
jgi:hypothetical protein